MIASEAGKLRETDRGEAALCNRRLVCRFLWLLQASRSRPLSYKPSMSDYLPLFFLMYLFWLFNSFNTSLCFCGCLPGSTTCPRSLCSHCKRCLSSEKCLTWTWTPTTLRALQQPPAPTSSPSHPQSLSVCLRQQNFRLWFLRMNFATVWVKFVHLRACVRRFIKPTSCPLLCASMWEL